MIIHNFHKVWKDRPAGIAPNSLIAYSATTKEDFLGNDMDIKDKARLLRKNSTDAEKRFWRTRFLQSKGYQVVRFWNNEVLGNLEGVLEALTLALSQRRVS